MNSFESEGSKRPRLRLWKNLKRYLMNPKQISILGCCGSSSWVLDNNNTGEQPLIFPEQQSPTLIEPVNTFQESYIGQNRSGRQDNDTTTATTTTMNLATALAADRNMEPATANNRMMNLKPLKSIVTLFEEVDGGDVDSPEDGIGRLCCLCTERNKGAALIPCGHTYCRVCSRFMWSKQDLCPLCNCLIKEILEIF